MNRFFLAIAFAFSALLAQPAVAAPSIPGNISFTVGVCDPVLPRNCIKPASNGSIAVTGGGGGGGGGASEGLMGAAVPLSGTYVGANSAGLLTGIIQADNSASINITTATTTQLVALSSGKKIYVTAFDILAGGTGNITLVYGTGGSCAVGTTALTGVYNLTAQAGISKGTGLGPVLVVPASNGLCALTSAAVQMSGSVAYTRF